VHDDLLVTDLVARAGNGEEQAWDALAERYSPLIWSICRRHRLGDADARAAGHSIWRTPRSAPGWASRSPASGRPAAAAWTSSAAIRRSRR
jgi:hypothetical protein